MDKLIIKLKIPQIPLNFSCPFCDKSFSCGKALGGHKRVHFLKTKSHYCRNINIPSNAEADQIKKSCPVCDQKFFSEKSLHGHMRKHPDRNWRGMVPPTEQQKPENNHDYPVHAPPQEDQEIKDYNSSDNQNHDLTLPAWPRSGRRSRYGKAPMNNDDDDDDDDHDQVTMSEVYDLMAIANVAANQKDSLSVPKKKKMEHSHDVIPSNGGNSTSQCKKSVVLENPGPGNEKTRNQSLGFEFNLNELPPEWTDDV